jgi:hypothetical protein
MEIMKGIIIICLKVKLVAHVIVEIPVLCMNPGREEK